MRFEMLGRGCRAFTLIELLAVMAIIGLLVTLVVPILGQVRLRGYELDCQSNLRQFGVALHQYASLNGDFLPAQTSMTESYFGRQDDLFAALEEQATTNTPIWFCKRFVAEVSRQRGIAPEALMQEYLANHRAGYFYWGWDCSGNRAYAISTTSRSNLWLSAGFQTNVPGLVLMTCRFGANAFPGAPQDWQLHAGRPLEVPLTEPGTFALLSGGSVLKLAPR